MPAELLLVVRAAYVLAYAAIAVVDLRERRVPNVITYPMLAVALVARPDGIGVVPLPNLAAAVIVAALFVLMTGRGWMGMGDAKLAAVIALAGGPALATIALWSAFLVGALVGVALLLTKRLSRGEPMPFGPFLALSGGVAAVAPGLLLQVSPFNALFS